MTIYNVKIYTLNNGEEIIENGYVTVENGKIAQVASGEFKAPSSEDIDGQGASVYPGFIDAHTHLGLTSCGVGIEGEDLNEAVDSCTPHLRIVDGINPMDYSFSMAVGAGVTTAVISPGSTNPVAGQITALKTYGKRVDKMSLGTVGMKFAMGENPKLTYMDNDESPTTRMAVAGIIREWLFKAKRYKADKENAENEEDMPEYDIRLESLIPVIEGKLTAHFHCHRADDIFTAIRIANEFNLKYTLIHCTDGHLIADELAEENASAVVGPVICDRCKPEMANLTPKNAGILSEKIPTAICTDHSEVPIEYLPVSVGICIKNGLSFYEGVKAVTKTPAIICGIFNRVGSLEKGKDADLVMFSENPFEVMSEPKLVMIEGKIIKGAN